MGHYPRLRSSRRSAGTLQEADIILVDIEERIVRRAIADHLLIGHRPSRAVRSNGNEPLYLWHPAPVGVERVGEAVVESDRIDPQLIDRIDVQVHVEMTV